MKDFMKEKDTMADKINKMFHSCEWNVKTATPIYRKTKFSARKFINSNS